MARTEDPDARPTVLGRVWRGTKASVRAPFSTFPAAAIGDNARLIARLFRQVRAGPDETYRTRSWRTEDGHIDLAATAFTLGMSEDRIAARVAIRRRETARLSYSAFTVGIVFVAVWVLRGLTTDLSGPQIIGALEFTPFVAIFFLVAFKYAHINWQLRTGTMGSAADYLRSTEPFLPR